MWKVLAAAVIGSAFAGSPAGAQLSNPYAQGVADWRALQEWFGSQTGDRAEGAKYWVANRNVPGRRTCAAAATGDKAAFIAGCEDAKSRLDPIDSRRRSYPEYRTGFSDESKREPLVAGATPAAPAPSSSPASVASAPVGGSSVTGKTTFRVIDIPSNDVLNIRRQATSQSELVGAIPPKGTGILYAGDRTADGRWFLIRYGNTTGWVASRYLQEERLAAAAATAPPSSPPPSISSDQADQRRLAEEEQQRQQKQAEAEQQKQAEAEKQRQAEAEKQRQAEAEKQRQAEAEKQRQAEAEKQRQAEAEERRQQQMIEETRHKLRKRGEEEQLNAKLKDLGFQLLTPVDLNLDWRMFGRKKTKVAVRGIYVEARDIEVLLTPENKDLREIRLFTSDASRDARKLMLECRNSARESCGMIVGATVQECVLNQGQLNEKEVPCLKVQEAYLIP